MLQYNFTSKISNYRGSQKMKAFISYSHKDKDHFNRLKVHLATLKRKQLIEDWSDIEIYAGQNIDTEIKQQMNSAELFLLLISPDFLNSKYCIETELRFAVERQNLNSAMVIPILVEPCHWQSIPELRDIKIIPEDAKPVSVWTNQDNAWLDVIKELERITEKQNPPIQYYGMARTLFSSEMLKNMNLSSLGTEELNSAVSTNKSKFREKRDFDEIDKSKFRKKSFKIISNFFKKNIEELSQIDGLKGHFERISKSKFSCIIINRNFQSKEAYITFRFSGDDKSKMGIEYSFDKNAFEDTIGGSLRVDFNEYELFLNSNFFTQTKQLRITEASKIAKLIWGEFARQAGIDYDE